MRCDGICLITDDVPRLARFYELVAGTAAMGDEVHAEIALEGAGLAIYARDAAARDMRLDFSVHFGAGRATIRFAVEDVDAEYERLRAAGVDFEDPPRTRPWGWRSAAFRDPDGHLLVLAGPP